ncbi:MAG: diguanylate cyclase [Gemmatimonadaceae bacterium]|nr:diguanylate cyclase [Gemmatimonadaceae bacterium]
MKPAPEGEQSAAERTALALAQLRDVNEQLVISTVRAQQDSEKSARELSLLTRAAELDALTSLPTRAMFLERMTQAMSTARRESTRLAVLFLDLNNFTQVNDSLGRAIGDEVLKDAAQRMKISLREADTLCRYGGDAFVMLLADVAERDDVSAIVQNIVGTLGRPMQYGAHVVRLTASVGISVFPDDGDEPSVLLERADAAMHRAKRGGTAGHGFHEEFVAEWATTHGPSSSADREPIPSQDAIAEREFQHLALRDANEQLVLAVLGAQAVQRELELANRRQSEFVAILAHELRNPLAPMSNVAAMLARVQADHPTLRKLQAIIERQVGHMTRLLDDLLDMTRVNTGKLRVTLEPMDLERIILRSIEERRSAMEVRLHRFTTDLPDVPVIVMADEVRLVQVIGNLLDNASKYTPNGGDIAVTLRVADSQAIITVTDSGIGISPEALPGIFELFAQDRHAVGFNGVGLGIGLTVVYELVLAHNGTVAAHSDGPGRGSAFIVSLPLAAPAA